jgi:hypothetical protein
MTAETCISLSITCYFQLEIVICEEEDYLILVIIQWLGEIVLIGNKFQKLVLGKGKKG